MFLKTVVADGQAERRVIAEMKARAAETRGDIENIVRGILEDVRENGMEAVEKYSMRFDKTKPYVISPVVLEKAYNACDPKLRAALEKAAANIRDYHEKMMVKTWEYRRSAGAVLGQTVRGLHKAGLYVPGGTAAYPSSVLMNAIPAKVAGVGELVMVTPPTDNLSTEVLAAAYIAGVDTVIAVGGTQAIAALAYGAGFIPQVDKIVGPGNIFVATAKRLLYGVVDIDMVAGPSEILVLADHTANPVYLAADLLSQAEHDRLASAILITTDRTVALRTDEELALQTEKLSRQDIVRESLSRFGAGIVCRTMDEAVEFANELAPEHLEIVTEDPMALLERLDNAGSVFLGSYSPEPLGDYFAGPNHVLPTSGTARFFSPLSVDSFVKRSSFISYTEQALRQAGPDIIKLAETEGLTAHAQSIRVRMQSES